MSWAVPVAGSVIGLIAAVLLLCLSWLGLSSSIVALLVVGALVVTTGGLHEDGLADVADGFGGGFTRERKLEIMRDSRVGSFGAIALIFSISLRVAAVAATLSHGPVMAASVLVAVSALSRAVGLMPLSILPPARADGAGASVSRPTREAMRQALAIGVIVSLLPLLAGASVAQTVMSIFSAFAGGMGITRLARREIGGYTGDVLGAAQQVAEIGALICLSA